MPAAVIVGPVSGPTPKMLASGFFSTDFTAYHPLRATTTGLSQPRWILAHGSRCGAPLTPEVAITVM
jgi:hypothetical protein